MSTSSLTAKYRPQTFDEVAGQQAIKTILSRAAAQDKVAPAYLFSGTRGVGKTTIARIFAKALNCVEAPTGEPCNKCDRCRQITAGVAVDVVEIDGASNRGIDDARRLKEDIGYAPLECRYKVFIIDEAHMLTKEAFNALLKTLEEPPPRVTFIMATTEPHKFPATIISRCQHYTYKMLTQVELVTHLESILEKEGISYDPAALQIIAKRGAGSVRDSMSLLGQALALGEDSLKEEDVRTFLGLAGQDVFFRLMESIHSQDLVGVGQTLREVLDQGLDLGFFLREMTSCWRNMFLLRQAGKAALPLLGFSGEEADTWLQWANKFSPAHIHACWQMTLDGQRRVMTSLEPAMALELLLLNMASLPELLNLESVGNPAAPVAPATGNRSGAPQGGGPGRSEGGFQPRPANGRQFIPQGTPSGQGNSAAQPAMRQHSGQPQVQGQSPAQSASPASAGNVHSGNQTQNVPPRQQGHQTPAGEFSSDNAMQSGSSDQRPKASEGSGEDVPAPPSEVEPSVSTANAVLDLPTPPNGPKSWQGFLEYVQACNGKSHVNFHHLRQASGELRGNVLFVTCSSSFLHKQLTAGQGVFELEQVAGLYWGMDISVRIETGQLKAVKSEKRMREEAETNSSVEKVMDAFGALIVGVSPRDQQH
jgi:DNA polymerase-3 subunit gamma/tau